VVIQSGGFIDRKSLHYDPKKVLGSGGSSMVYKGTYDGTPVAIKEIKGSSTKSDSEIRRVYMQEAARLNDLEHPNTVRIWGISRDLKGSLLLVLEFCSKGSLHDLLRHEPRLSWEIRKKMLLQTCNALKFLHMKTTFHGDLKTMNIMVGDGYEVKLGDFGLSKKLTNRTDEIQARSFTIVYAAPELMSQKPAGLPADVFSFGFVAWEVITMQDISKFLRMARVNESRRYGGALPPLDTMTPDQRDLVRSCWRLNSQERPTFAQLLDKIEKL